MFELKAFEFAHPDKSCRFQPEYPFLLKGFLAWTSSALVTSITIDGEEQLVSPIPLKVFECPFLVEEVRDLIKFNLLEDSLPDHLRVAQYASANSGSVIELTFEGSCEHLLFWGIYRR